MKRNEKRREVGVGETRLDGILKWTEKNLIDVVAILLKVILYLIELELTERVKNIIHVSRLASLRTFIWYRIRIEIGVCSVWESSNENTIFFASSRKSK